MLCNKKNKGKIQHQHCCSNNSSSGGIIHMQGCDFEGLSEKYWGEILERTLSSNSLHALQKAYNNTYDTQQHHYNRRMERYCNGLEEMNVLDTAVPDL